MKKHLQSVAFLSAFFLLFAAKTEAQFNIGNDTTICSAPFTLHAGGNIGTVTGPTPTFLDCGSFNGCDDGYSINVINLGFTFNYYGINYTQCVIGTNGIINFDVSVAGTYCQWPISAAIPSSSDPMNSIMWPWQDLYYPAAAGGTAFMSYATFGTAPNRYIVFDFNSVPMFSCNVLTDCQQITLYETTNIIEIPIANKPLCSGWNSGYAIEGVQNSTGTLADWVPGRNFPTNWTATNDCYRFIPNGANYTVAPFAYSPTPMFVGASINWFQNGISIGTGDSMVVNPPVGTTQYIAVTSNCGTVISDTMNLTLDPMTLSMASINPTCANAANGSITATATGTAPYSYTWTDSTGAVIHTDLNVNGPSSVGNLYMGKYYVSVIGALGCVLVDSVTLTAAFFQAEFTSTPTGYCQDDGLQFLDASIGVAPTDWDWSFGDLSTGTSLLQNPIHFYPDSGLFTATLIIKVPGGCSDTVSHVIQVWPHQIGNFTVTPTIGCVHRNITFKDASTMYPKQWAWSNSDDTTTSTANIFQHAFDSSGTYTITLVVTDSLCGTDTVTQFMNVFDYPVTDIGKDTAICLGSQVNLDCHIPGMKYLWTNDATTQSILVAPTKETKYGVTIDNHGCLFTDDITIGIECELFVPNAFSPNKDGFNDIFLPYGSAVTGYGMRIYDRWGEMVFECSSGSELNKGWDGMFKTELAAMGVYTYVIKATFINNLTKEYKGNVTLLR